MTRPVTALCDALTATIDISADADMSDIVNLGGRIPVAIYIPATWTAANITFDVSYDGTAFAALYDTAAAEVTVTGPAANQCHAVNPELFMGATHVRLKTSAGQAADREIIIMAARPAR